MSTTPAKMTIEEALETPGPFLMASDHPYIKGYVAAVDAYCGYAVEGAPDYWTQCEKLDYQCGYDDARGMMGLSTL